MRFLEPDWCRLARTYYWQPYVRLRALEARLCATDGGTAWFYRMKARTAASPLRGALR